ncbi:hypothetical protein FQB35_09850 [Crassaminicella thermophila]|uniref:Uncharacterized protein n=1 Tax=Crassaminicella thermophila TaxID=2599308 RepID=A0A5C0SDH9_CRATE|nr:hypothetical protein [Crassaminicella thermophila]QEK12605.1 hypothetical protein FQB35_09850 [Crassaminicella thermophila]
MGPEGHIQTILTPNGKIEDELRIIIPDIPPSNNKYMGRGSTYTQAFSVSSRKRKKMAVGNRLASPRTKKWAQNPLKKGRGRNYLFLQKTKRRRDPDNYSGKFILDSLVRAGVLQDDSFWKYRINLEREL